MLLEFLISLRSLSITQKRLGVLVRHAKLFNTWQSSTFALKSCGTCVHCVRYLAGRKEWSAQWLKLDYVADIFESNNVQKTKRHIIVDGGGVSSHRWVSWIAIMLIFANQVVITRHVDVDEDFSYILCLNWVIGNLSRDPYHNSNDNTLTTFIEFIITSIEDHRADYLNELKMNWCHYIWHIYYRKDSRKPGFGA